MTDRHISIAAQAETLVELLGQVKDEYGWGSVAYLVEVTLLRLGVEDWAVKAPGSVSRLKRLRQALLPVEPQ